MRLKDVPRRPGAEGRIAWLDVAKGLGIVVVVAGHALGGIIDMGSPNLPPAFRMAFVAIYVFHMPLFFFLSGLMVRSRLTRSRKGFFIDLLLAVAYPYFLWSTIQYGVIYTAGSLVNRPVGMFWPVIAKLPLVSVSQFWFLYVLFLLHMAALVVVPRVGARVLFASALVAKLIVAVPHLGIPVMLRLTMVHGTYYAAGVWMGAGGAERMRLWLARYGWLAPLLIAGGAAAVMAASMAIGQENAPQFDHMRSWEISVLAWRLPVTPAALIAVTGALALAFLCRGAAARVLAYLGRRTMAIFVLHVLFLAGVRILLTRHGHHPGPWVLLAVGVLAGLIAPLVVHAITRRFTRSRMTGLG